MTFLPFQQNRRGQTLIGLLIAIFLLSIVGASLYLQLRKGGPGGRSPEDQANEVACSEYTSQIRQAIMQYKQDNEGRNPPDLKSLGKYGVTPDILNAPGCSYPYDPSTGTVQNGVSKPGQPARQFSQQSSPGQSPSGPQSSGGPSGLPTTTVNGPSGAPIRVPSGYGGGGNPDAGNGGEGN